LTKLDWASVYAGVNLLILFLLAFGVVRARQKHKVSLGDGGNPAVLQAMRAHGNATEYIPAALVGLGLLAILDPVPILAVQVLGGVFTFGRVLHGIGLSTSGGVSAGRMIGILSTWLAFLGIGGFLIWAGLSPLL
jgi:uncharacterized membrane protein YecN with MAPEG domain